MVVTADEGVFFKKKYKGLEDTPGWVLRIKPPKDMRNTQVLFTRYLAEYSGRSTLRVAVKRLRVITYDHDNPNRNFQTDLPQQR